MPEMQAFEDLIEHIEQMITARNTEEYRLVYPDVPPPPIPYVDMRVATLELWRQCTPTVHAEIVTSGADGRATVTFEEMTTPVVALGRTTNHLVIVEAVTTTSATVRVLDGVTGVPSINVHVTVTDADPPPPRNSPRQTGNRRLSAKRKTTPAPVHRPRRNQSPTVHPAEISSGGIAVEVVPSERRTPRTDSGSGRSLVG